MKRTNKKEWITWIVIVIALLLASCKKEVDSPNYIKGKIDGVPFECTIMTANEPEPGSNNSDKDPHIRVEGGWATNTIKLHLLNESVLTAKTYLFESGKDRYATIRENNTEYGAGYFFGLPSVFIGSGRITITEINKKSVKGTFEFTATLWGAGTKTVTDGEFQLTRN